jgi:hypothetical protein
MAQVIGDILPLALGIAISPIPIIAAILMLLSPQAKGTSVGFLIGWVLGIVITVALFTVLSSIIPQTDSDEPQPIAGVLKIVLGAGLLLMALRQWHSRPQGNEEAPLPKWMAAIDSMTATRGLLLGFALAALNPKNLLMGIAAGVIIGSGALDVATIALSIGVFTILAACTVAIPVIAFLVATDKMTAPLDGLRKWLLHNNATVMAVLLLTIGVSLLGKGIGSF